MPLENLGERLRARFEFRVPSRHAVTHIQVSDEVHRKPCDRVVAQACVGQRADAALHVAGVQVDDHGAVDIAVRVVERMQLGIQQFSGPRAVVGRGEPAFLRVMNERTLGARLAEIEVGPEIVAAQALEEFAERARTRGKFGCALAVGEQQRTILIAHVHRPDVLGRIEPGAFFEEEAARRQLLLHGGDGKFQRCILARNKAFGLHDMCLYPGQGGVRYLMCGMTMT